MQTVQSRRTAGAVPRHARLLEREAQIKPVPRQVLGAWPGCRRNGSRTARLAFLTSSDYVIAMSHVRIADLKSRLSEYLRKVRSGRTLTVLDRNTPIARIVPYEENGSSLTVRAPLPGAPQLQRVPLPPPLRLRRDIVELLKEERQGER